MDSKLHAILPWVTDFTTQNGGWRDLTKSQNRLHHGDQMLDVTYENSVPRHHIAECLSELTYFMYEARRTPINTLRRTVRANFVAAHYPATMKRLYECTPDECTPAFYCDPAVLRSIHKGRGLDDMQVCVCACVGERVACSGIATPSYLRSLCARHATRPSSRSGATAIQEAGTRARCL